MRLRGKIIFATLPVVVLAMLVLGTVAYLHLRTQAEHELQLQTRTLLDQTVSRGRTLVKTAEANARLFASTSLIEQYVRVTSEADRYELIQPALLRLFSGYRRAFPEYREIRLVLPDGFEDTRLASPELVNSVEEEAASEWFRAVRAEPDADVIVHFANHADDGTFSLFVTRPIRLVDSDQLADWHAPRLRGYLSINASLATLFDAVRSARVGRSGHLVLIDRHGHTLASGGEPLPRALTERLLEGGTITDSIVNRPDVLLRGEPTRIYGRWLYDGALILAVLPEAEFVHSAKMLALTVSAVILSATLLISCLLLFSLRQLVLRPVGVLRDAAVAIGGGVPFSFPACGRSDELGELARAFRRMHERVNESVADLKASHHRIEQLAYRDELTGLPNRRCLLEHMRDTLERADAARSRFAVLFLDLDEFKRVNDLLGHEAGDRLLGKIAERLTRCAKAYAASAHSAMTVEQVLPCGDEPAVPVLVARLGGDEFMLFCAFDTARDIDTLAASIVTAIHEPMDIGEHRFNVGTSIGIACWPADADSVQELVKRADMAMYSAKGRGKNTWCRFDAAMHAHVAQQAQLEAALCQAVAQDQLSVVYQPQYATGEDRIIGVEALLRWHHPEFGNVPPAEFIPVAEQTGLIGEIGAWVLRTACEQWREWVQSGLPPLRIGVNVSPRQLRGTALLKQVEAVVRDCAMQASCLELEVTETCMMEAPEEVVKLLERLRRKGVRIAMDDFGTGYTSLSALTLLPIDTLKIDRRFVANVQTDSERDKVVSTIVTLAHSLELDIVAEGVETAAEYDFLACRNCSYVQGYLFGKPLGGEAMTTRLRNAHSLGSGLWKKAG